MSNEFETDDNLDEVASSLVDGEATGVPDSRLNELLGSDRFRESIDDFSWLSDQLKSPVPVDGERRSAQIGAALAAFDLVDGSADADHEQSAGSHRAAPVTDLAKHRQTSAARREGFGADGIAPRRNWSPLLAGVAALFLAVVGFGLVRVSSNGFSDSDGEDATADFTGEESETATEAASSDDSSNDNAESEDDKDEEAMEDEESADDATPASASAALTQNGDLASDTDTADAADAEDSTRHPVIEGRVVIDLIEPGPALGDLAVEYSQDVANSECAIPLTEAGVVTDVVLLQVDDEPIDLFVVEDSTGPISGIALRSQTCEITEEYSFS